MILIIKEVMEKLCTSSVTDSIRWYKRGYMICDAIPPPHTHKFNIRSNKEIGHLGLIHKNIKSI
jgi:hypothetical protein